nr:PREDICTED: protein tweety homolog 3-like [Apteryx mantelli mantelli]
MGAGIGAPRLRSPLQFPGHRVASVRSPKAARGGRDTRVRLRRANKAPLSAPGAVSAGRLPRALPRCGPGTAPSAVPAVLGGQMPSEGDYLDALIGVCYDGLEGLLYLILFSLLVAASFSTIICATPRAWRHLASRWVQRGSPLSTAAPQDYLDALIGVCYDGLEGLLYLILFSLLVAASFSTIICATPHAWRHLASRLEAAFPPHPLPSSEVMQDARAGVEAPPRGLGRAGQRRAEPRLLSPQYSPSMRATYLSVTDEHVRRHNTEFPA